MGRMPKHVFQALLAAALLGSTSVPASAQLIYQQLRSIPSFNPLDGNNTPYGPAANLIEGRDHALYGTLSGGGTSTNGGAFRLNKDGTGFTVLLRFAGAPGDGAAPLGSLVEGSDGALFGTTYGGGNANAGTVFKLTSIGRGAYTNALLKSFGGSDGANPRAGLLLASDGVLYGTASSGGAGNKGLIFKINTNGTGYTSLRSFLGAPTDGASPQGALIEGVDGALYGTTRNGGTNNLGTVFKIDKGGSNYSMLKSLTSATGTNPVAGLIEGSDHVLYGTAYGGGLSGQGTVFKLNENGTGFGVLMNFAATPGDGKNPAGSLAEGTDGTLYGTTYSGGASNQGTIFKLNTNGGGYAVLWSFSYFPNPGGINPLAGLARGVDGGFYGTTSSGGDRGPGTVFSLGARPVNDAFANRIPLAGQSASGSGHNLNATSEPNEPVHGDPADPVTNSVWWSWSGLSNGLVTIVNNNDTMNSLIDVYRETTSSTVCATTPSGLVNWWPGNGDANDIVGGNNGTLLNGTSFAPGEVNQAFSFAGTLSPTGNSRSNIIQIGATPITPPWTAEFWVNRQDCLTNSVVLLGDSNVALKLEQFPGGRKVGFTTWGSTDYSFNYVAPAGAWVHLVFAASATSVALYTNGVLQSSLAAMNINLPRGQLGNDITNRYERPLRGLVDEVSLYNRLLSASEIAALYNAGAAGKCLPAAAISLTNLTSIASNSSPQYLGSPNRVSFVATAGATYQIAVSGTFGPDTNYAASGDISLSLRTLDLRILSVNPMTNADSTITLSTSVQIGNARAVTSGPLRLQFVARPGYSVVQTSSVPTALPPTQILTNYLLANPSSLAPGATTNVSVANLICPAPTNYFYAGVSNYIGWGVFAILQMQVGTNWLAQDSDLVLYGAWPEAGGFIGPGGGVIRIDPVGGGTVALSRVKIIGPTAVNEGSTNSYHGTAYFDDIGYQYDFTDTTWNSTLPSISGSGVFTPGIVTTTATATLTCYYTYDTISSASLAVWVTNLPPPFLTNVSRLADKRFQMTVKGVPGRKHVIQAATNLASPSLWTNLVTITNNGTGTSTYIDFGATNILRRFYRAFETP
jgi:uncharacterized repeat protein (TIGR03803 family)